MIDVCFHGGGGGGRGRERERGREEGRERKRERCASRRSGYFLRVIKIVPTQSDFSNLICPLEGQRNQLEIEAEHCRRTKL